jgi:hypothetical protein
MTTRMAGSASTWSRAAENSARSGVDSAFSFSGRVSVMTAMPSSGLSRRMSGM